MENYLIQLNLERDYEEMMKHLLDKEGVESVNSFYEGINTKLLLSSFLIRNFYKYFLLTDRDELVKISKEICKNILENDKEKVNKNYHKFHSLFVQWRDYDIRAMKHEIEGARTQLENIMTENPPADDAEEQWNEGVAINVKIMDNTIKMLDIYGKTPPKK